jgi:alpha-ribazole phosphatase
MKLYLVRHGATEYNLKRFYQGWSDTALCAEGIQQCEHLREKLSRVHFDAVISSPLRRAVHSAQLISGLNPDQIRIEAGLKEFHFGLWEGLKPQEAERLYPEEWRAWTGDWMSCGPPRGEVFREFYWRVKDCFTGLITNNPAETLLVVSHDGPLKVIAGVLLRLPPEGYWSFAFESGCYSLFEVCQDRPIVWKINT